MSHTVTVSVKMTNKEALLASIKHLDLQSLGEGNHRLFDGNHQGIGFKLPNWNYPVVVKPQTGEAVYDNYNGGWGKQEELDKVVQRYACEVARLDSEASGFFYNEEVLENGDIAVEMEKLVAVG